MDKLISVLICILLTTFSLAGCIGDSDNQTSEDTDNSENTGNNETIILFEGDQVIPENVVMVQIMTVTVYSIVMTRIVQVHQVVKSRKIIILI